MTKNSRKELARLTCQTLNRAVQDLQSIIWRDAANRRLAKDASRLAFEATWIVIKSQKASRKDAEKEARKLRKILSRISSMRATMMF